jgi:hypothetical protein
MRSGAGAWVVRGVFVLLAVVAWQTGVYFAGVVSGVAATWVVARLRLED